MASRDVDIFGHRMSSVCDEDERSFHRMWLSNVLERKAASVQIQSFHLLLENLYEKNCLFFHSVADVQVSHVLEVFSENLEGW